MSTNSRPLTERQKRMIPFLLTSRSTEEACRRARINKSTVYEWIKDEGFRNELKVQREAVIQEALQTLKGSIVKATETLVRHLGSKRENISIRAAEKIIDFAQKASRRISRDVLRNWRPGLLRTIHTNDKARRLAPLRKWDDLTRA